MFGIDDISSRLELNINWMKNIVYIFMNTYDFRFQSIKEIQENSIHDIYMLIEIDF